MTTINTTDLTLQTKIWNKISPKILSSNANFEFFSEDLSDTAYILLKLRKLNKFSIETISKKLNITEAKYKSMEKGLILPSPEISKLLVNIYNLNPNPNCLETKS